MSATRRKDAEARKLTDDTALARACARLADEKKGGDITILDLRGLTYITDFFIIASADNARQLRAMGDSIEKAMSGLGKRPLGIQGTERSGWVLLDYGDFVVHLFDVERRKLYDLELLWGDAPRIEWATQPPTARVSP